MTKNQTSFLSSDMFVHTDSVGTPNITKHSGTHVSL